MTSSDFFELTLPLPDPEINRRTETLVGFEARYARLAKDIRLMLDPEALARWSKKHHGRELHLCSLLGDRYPLIVFHGDVGTGKTATAEGFASRMAAELAREAVLYKLSTRVRGSGLHGEMTKLIGEAFQAVTHELGKKRIGFLLIDEADALASSRETSHSHQEEKAGTNSLIQQIDDARRFGGRFVVLLCTNRLSAVDPAIVRRGAHVLAFGRPTAEERLELLTRDLAELKLSKAELDQLVEATGPKEDEGRMLGLTFSDLRTRFLPTAVLESFPDRPLTFETLLTAARATPASAQLDS